MDLKDHENVIAYGRDYLDEKSADASLTKYYIIKAAYLAATSSNDCPGACLKYNRGIELFENMMKSGWIGKEKDEAQEYYDKMIAEKQKLTIKTNK